MARVLITGCSTGIGRATAIELTARGHDVVASARRLGALDGLDVAARVELDVDDDASVVAAVAGAGDIDVLVNNAGWEAGGPIERVPLARVKAMFETSQSPARGRGSDAWMVSITVRLIGSGSQPWSSSHTRSNWVSAAA